MGLGFSTFHCDSKEYPTKLYSEQDGSNRIIGFKAADKFPVPTFLQIIASPLETR